MFFLYSVFDKSDFLKYHEDWPGHSWTLSIPLLEQKWPDISGHFFYSTSTIGSYKMHAESWELDLNSEFRVLTSWISLTLSSTIQNACNNKNDLKVGIVQHEHGAEMQGTVHAWLNSCCTERAHQRLSKTSRFDRARWKSQQYTTRLPCSVSNSIDRFTENDLIFQVISSHRIRNRWNRVVKRGCANVEFPRSRTGLPVGKSSM